MRNLKKILALVLALVMSLSLMATASAADTTATDTSPYQTAVDVLKGVSVVKGDDRGDRLSDPITRAEVTALLYRIATGDVADTQTAIHTGQGFTDVNANDWYAGYISYCYIAEIIKGNPNGTFQPDNNINGYATLAMILRAMGYDKKGEFVGDGWEIRTASTAKQIGILEGITDTQLSGNASRALVFQILFRAIFKDTVRYNALHEDYDPTGENLAKLNLGLEEITGVVVANEIADLGNSSPLAAGRTNLVVGEKTYKLKDFTTTAEEIGTSIHAYVKDSKVLAHEDAGSDIKDNEGAATSVKSLRGELSITDATEYYVNFDPVLKDTSDWVITYKAPVGLVKALGLSNAELTDNGCTLKTDGWNKTIRVGAKITAIDMAIIQEIFEYDDAEFDGEVYAGTSPDDRSNTMTWKKFRAEFLNLDENDAISACDNGEWLRVIDSNNDGVVDYVLRTDFVMTTVVDYEKRTDVYEVEWKGGLPNGNGKGTIPASAIVKASEDTDLSVGSVILYTLIDGNYYVSNPDVVTLTVDKKSINSKAGTFAADGETYTWSGIDEKAVKYYDTVSQLAYETKYDMYPDHFGYIRLATEASRNFVLLTDGYYATDNRTSVMKADLYDGENAVYDVNVSDHAATNTADGFIDTLEDDHLGNASTWLRLNTFGEFYAITDDDATPATPALPDGTPPAPGTPAANWWVHYGDKNGYDYNTNGAYTDSSNTTYYADPFYTNIALGSENDGVWALEDVTNLDVEYNGLYRKYNTYELVANGFGATDLWGITSWNNNDTVKTSANQAIQANGRTLYYYVENPGAHGEDLKVQSWVGYQNVPEALKGSNAKRAYAVTHEIVVGYDSVHKVDIIEKYEIADVVVIEGVPGSGSKNPQLITTGITSKRENALGFDGENYTEHDTAFGLFTSGQLRSVVTYDTDGLYAPQLNFYDASYNKGTTPITSNFNAYGIYAGYVTVGRETKDSDYIQITYDHKLTGTRIGFHADEVPVFEIDQNTSRDWHGTDNLSVREVENIKSGDMLIVLCDGDSNVNGGIGSVKMVINVSASGKDGETYRNNSGVGGNLGRAIIKLNNLFEAIVREETGNSFVWLEMMFGSTPFAVYRINGFEDGLTGLVSEFDDENDEYIWNDGTHESIKDAIKVYEEDANGNMADVTSTVAVNVFDTDEGTAFSIDGLKDNQHIRIQYQLKVPFTLDDYFDEGAASYIQVANLAGVNADDDEIYQNFAVAAENGVVGATGLVTFKFEALSSLKELGVIQLQGFDGVGDRVVAKNLTIAEDQDQTGVTGGYTRYSTSFNMPEYYGAAYLVVVFWELEEPAPEEPEVEPDTIVPSTEDDEREDISFEKNDEVVNEYLNVVDGLDVIIPAAYDSNKVSFQVYVPAGQYPAVDNDQLPANVKNVTFTKVAAPATETLAVEPDIYQVVINLYAAPSTKTTVTILLLDKETCAGEDIEDVAPEAATDVTVTVGKATLHDVAGKVSDSALMVTGYNVTETNGTVTVTHPGVYAHTNPPAKVGNWVGFEVAMDATELANGWTHVIYKFSGKEGFSTLEDLGAGKKGIAFYYDATEDMDDDEVEVTFVKKAAGQEDVLSKTLTYTVEFHVTLAEVPELNVVAARLWDTSKGTDTGTNSNVAWTTYEVDGSGTEWTLTAVGIPPHTNGLSGTGNWAGVAFVMNKGDMPAGASAKITAAKKGNDNNSLDKAFTDILVENAEKKGDAAYGNAVYFGDITTKPETWVITITWDFGGGKTVAVDYTVVVSNTAAAE